VADQRAGFRRSKKSTGVAGREQWQRAGWGASVFASRMLAPADELAGRADGPSYQVGLGCGLSGCTR